MVIIDCKSLTLCSVTIKPAIRGEIIPGIVAMVFENPIKIEAN